MSDQAKTTETMAAEDWAGEMGERWLRNLDRFESMIAPVGEALLQRADYKAGETVLDIGCGGGASARAIAGLSRLGDDRSHGTSMLLGLATAMVPTAPRRFNVAQRTAADW